MCIESVGLFLILLDFSRFHRCFFSV
jgi:hypothetical protein